MTWTKEEETKLVDMYEDNRSTIEMANALGKRTSEIDCKLLEFNRDPYVRPVDVNQKCPSCGAGVRDLKLLDLGLTTRKWYYKCVKCNHVFSET